jgi:adenylosuccinate lyase
VQAHALRSFDEGRDFRTLLASDPDMGRVLPAAAIDEAFDLDRHLRHVDAIFARVFGPSSQETPPPGRPRRL